MEKDKKQLLFDRNFNVEAYEKARQEIVDCYAASCDQLIEALDGYDVEDEEDVCSFYCTKELDRSNLDTDADYVEVEFLIEWDKKYSFGYIYGARLYVGYPNGDGGQICAFDPYNLDINEWFI